VFVGVIETARNAFRTKKREEKQNKKNKEQTR